MNDGETSMRQDRLPEHGTVTDEKKPGGRPTLALENRRTERISFGVTKVQKAAFLINAAEAGLSSNDYARQVLCRSGAAAGGWAGGGAGKSTVGAPTFELVDSLTRIGVDLARLRFIADQTGVVPDGLGAVIARLDCKLDLLLVGSGLADELAAYRDRLNDIAERLETSGQMSERARGMIATVNAVISKVLSA